LTALSGKQKASIFLRLLGRDASAKILNFLPKDLAQILLSQSGELSPPSREAVAEVLDEFNKFLSLPSGRGALNTAKPVSALDILIQTSPSKLVKILSEERNAVLVFILSMLPVSVASDVLLLLAERRANIEDLRKIFKRVPIAEKLKEKIIQILIKRVSE
jgi:flagellar motor switch protein FliG